MVIMLVRGLIPIQMALLPGRIIILILHVPIMATILAIMVQTMPVITTMAVTEIITITIPTGHIVAGKGLITIIPKEFIPVAIITKVAKEIMVVPEPTEVDIMQAGALTMVEAVVPAEDSVVPVIPVEVDLAEAVVIPQAAVAAADTLAAADTDKLNNNNRNFNN